MTGSSVAVDARVPFTGYYLGEPGTRVALSIWGMRSGGSATTAATDYRGEAARWEPVRNNQFHG
ncbi:hypothetical protein [Demequina gelatinilytica]|uniref:hypothetical protein n=1 Tax=Demequina gelatinilytica TaxID=1638980 RepID=UPI000784B106|nr:hypothetical protein [Demequina gelatinilytica]